MQKPRRHHTKGRYRLPELTEWQWRTITATLSFATAVIQLLDNHWK